MQNDNRPNNRKGAMREMGAGIAGTYVGVATQIKDGIITPAKQTQISTYFVYRRGGGRYYTSAAGIDSAFTTTQVLTANFMYAMPFMVPKNEIFDRIAIKVTTLSAGTAYLGIYADDGTIYPGALELDASTVDTGSTGIKEITINQTLAPGLHWCVIHPSATPTVRAVNNASHSSQYFGHADLDSASDFGVSVNRGSFGALPATFPAAGSIAAVSIVVALRKA